MPRDISQYHYRPENVCYCISAVVDNKKLQLYSKRDIGGYHFVSIYGALHVVFAMSIDIGKYMENSGLNKQSSVCGIYNPLAVGNIIGGKHMERCVSAI